MSKFKVGHLSGLLGWEDGAADKLGIWLVVGIIETLGSSEGNELGEAERLGTTEGVRLGIPETVGSSEGNELGVTERLGSMEGV